MQEKQATIKVGMVSLGCAKNQVDAEHMLADLKSAGYELCAEPGLCDAVIVNTCGFIEDAKKESIENILEFAALKKEKRIKLIAVTGCLAERYQASVAEEFPEADVILGIGKNANIAAAIAEALSGNRVISFGDKNIPLEGERVLANLPFYAYLKVADGCDNRCTYCAIPLIRGSFRSREFQDIVKEAEDLAAKGVTELNVVAQDTTRYGEDIYDKLMLPALLRRLCEIKGLRWIRVLYCYPERVTDELLDVMAHEPKIVKYMDLPLQHVSGKILKAMNRRGDPESLADLIAKIRARVPGISLRTTFITGFPGETEEDFESLVNFVKEQKFERLGCFAYSQEEDTPAAMLEGQIDEEAKKRRAEIVMETQAVIAAGLAESKLGREMTVLCEGYDRLAGAWFGRGEADAPDIDTKVFFTTKTPVKPGDYVTVAVEEAMDYDLIGTRV